MNSPKGPSHQFHMHMHIYIYIYDITKPIQIHRISIYIYIYALKNLYKYSMYKPSTQEPKLYSYMDPLSNPKPHENPATFKP